MGFSQRAFAVLLVLMIFAGAMAPVSMVPTASVFMPETSAALADTNLIVTDEVTNLDGHYDDDDFVFHVHNYTSIIGNANVSLYFANESLFISKLTSPSNGKAEFLGNRPSSDGDVAFISKLLQPISDRPGGHVAQPPGDLGALHPGILS